jgi:hypothetical protein
MYVGNSKSQVQILPSVAQLFDGRRRTARGRIKSPIVSNPRSHAGVQLSIVRPAFEMIRMRGLRTPVPANRLMAAHCKRDGGIPRAI